ncbi:ABC transporter ATP-binding protein [Porphyromonas crevioricanis]|uniref:ABC transporter ATP-binding protein n=1 Tax=Porphyromonas crevioricanis TaxID=393921 RepID=A0AB34PE80_9PORP|nr:ABC transporter ATP-binding protein [Porphyromonas crevioricanis]KGN93042.1 ABC transporter ATP-binding protein [Porphyromonas crevioricanis]
MISYFQNRFALSRQGGKSLFGGIAWTTLLNIALMLPAVFTFLFLDDYFHALALHGWRFYIAVALAFMLILFALAMIQYTNTYTNVYVESASRRIGLAEKLRKLPLAFFAEKNLSDLTATLMEDNSELEKMFSHSIPQLFASFLSLSLVGLGLFCFNWQLSLPLLWVVPVAAAVIFVSKKFMLRLHRKHYFVKRAVTERIQEGLEEIQEIKSYNGEADYLAKLDDELDSCEQGMIKGELLVGCSINISYIILKLGLASVILVGAYLLVSGEVDLFTYLVFLMIGSTIYNPIMEVFNNMAILAFLDVRIDRMREMDAMPIQQGTSDFQVSNYDITFEEVDFSYGGDRQVLRSVSFTARQGEVTALVGPSGGGKSTSAKLAARFWDVDHGRIFLGGVDISTIDPESLLRHYAIVFQDVLLFNASVMDNIRIGRQDATDEEVRAVARLARCDEFVSRLPNGYDTIIGENGERLSGGERQRISIARALLKDAPVVLLDEATASLDVENESQIQSAISELIRNKTVLIIAHRMRTVANAHKIVVLKDGRVVESGHPAELLKQGGEFAHLFQLQHALPLS